MTVIDKLQREGVKVDRLCLDSRQVQSGDVFVACQGSRVSGQAFIGDAVNRGAAAVLYEAGAISSVRPEPVEGQDISMMGCDRLSPIDIPMLPVPGLAGMLGDIANLVYGRPSEKLSVIGVTGTNGKTSVSQWITQALFALDRRCAVMGTLGNGFPDQLKESPNTTPDAIAVHSGLAGFVAQGATACAMEVSSIGLDQGRVNGVTFDTAVFTNLSRDHLDYHADMSTYAAAKEKLFATPGLKTAVLNLDDPFGLELAQMLQGKLHTIGYSLGSASTKNTDEILFAEHLQMTAAGVQFVTEGVTVSAPVIGRFNVSNLLAVFGSLRALGIDAAHAATALASLTPPPGRLQTVAGSNQKVQPLVVVDYAHTPDALDKALSTLREIASTRGGKLVCVFGCGGDRDAGKRPMMGAVAERLADQVIVTSDNPRGESPEHIAAQIVAGMQSTPLVELDRARAIGNAIAAAHVNDVVLLAGKGHESYQEVAGVKHPFSDIEIAQRILEQRS
jgi:UDP-N-acetylmuramoyl-L-alanyl-D-glutamate--2,6-diaminopimelate ligase